MSVGYAAGGRAGDRWPRVETLAATLLLAGTTLMFIPPLDGTLSGRIAATGNLSLHAFVVSTLLFAVPTMLLAAVSPIAVRLLARSAAESGSVAGGISGLSTIGSVAGSIAAAFFLIDAIGSIDRTVLLLGVCTAALALILAVPVRARAIAALSAALLLTGGLAFIRTDRTSEAMTSEGTRVLFERDSPYHHVRVTQRPGRERDLYLDATLQARLYVGDPNDRGLQYPEYVHITRLIRPSVRRALLIGLGAGTLAKQFTRYYPDTTVDAIEIDPLVVEAAEKFFGVRAGERLRIHVGDGRAFLSRQNERYDLISIDAYTRGRYGSTIPPHLVTREFFLQAREKLTAEGFVHFHSYAPRQNRFTRSIYKTMASVYPSLFVFGHSELIASNVPIQIDAAELTDRADAIRGRLPQIAQMIATVREPVPDSTGVEILTDDHAPVDALLRGHSLSSDGSASVFP
jgi:spermidine synthase